MTILATAHATPHVLLGSVSRTVGLPRQLTGRLPRQLAGRRPWLPAGETLRGRIFRPGLDPAVGVALVDEPGVLDARIRLGHAPALAGAGAGVTTMAVRFEQDGRPADLVLAAQPAPRGTPRLRRGGTEEHGPLLVSSTAYDAAGRPLRFAARACGSETFEILCLLGDPSAGRWRSVADLRVCPHPLGEQPLVADPLAHPPTGLAVLSPWEGRAV